MKKLKRKRKKKLPWDMQIVSAKYADGDRAMATILYPKLFKNK